MPEMPRPIADRVDLETISARALVEVVLDVPEDDDERADKEAIAAINRHRLLATRGEKEAEAAQHDQHRHEHEKGVAVLHEHRQCRTTMPALDSGADAP